jgi:multidrug efflux pump subunit AcrA (membrane-fusion protein)
VKTAGTYQDLTVVSTGLKPGERVIVGGHLRVAPNAKVVVQSTASNAQPDASARTSSGGGNL